MAIISSIASRRIPSIQSIATRSLAMAASSSQPFNSFASFPPTPPTSIQEALTLLRSQNNHYIIADLKGRSYLLTKNDILTLPRLNDVQVGDRLELSLIREIGSRDFTLRGSPYIGSDETLPVSVYATVIEHKKAKMIDVTKFKKRKNYRRLLHHKQTHTVLRIGDIHIHS